VSAHSSVPHLSEEKVASRDQLESDLLTYEGIDFVGVSFLITEDKDIVKITLGTTQLDIAKAQLLNIVPYLERQGLTDIEVELVRGRVK
jgi:hypothetical protein